MAPIRVTAVVRAAIFDTYAQLTDPRHIARYLAGVGRSIAAETDPQNSAGTRRARWLFRAEPDNRRIHWELTTPTRVAGTLTVYGDCSISQLWLTVHTRPSSWPPETVRQLAHAVLHQISERLEDDLARSGRLKWPAAGTRPSPPSSRASATHAEPISANTEIPPSPTIGNSREHRPTPLQIGRQRTIALR